MHRDSRLGRKAAGNYNSRSAPDLPFQLVMTCCILGFVVLRVLTHPTWPVRSVPLQIQVFDR